MPEPDVEAGWAALVAQLEPPVAPVVPLRRPRPAGDRRSAVAAAILIGGSAFAMVAPRRGTAAVPRPRPVSDPPDAVDRPHTPSGRSPAHRPRSDRRRPSVAATDGGTGHRAAPPRRAVAPARRRRDEPADAHRRTTTPGRHRSRHRQRRQPRRQRPGNNTSGQSSTRQPRRQPTGRATTPGTRAAAAHGSSAATDRPLSGTFFGSSRTSRPLPPMGRVTTPGHTPSPSATGAGLQPSPPATDLAS